MTGAEREIDFNCYQVKDRIGEGAWKLRSAGGPDLTMSISDDDVLVFTNENWEIVSAEGFSGKARMRRFDEPVFEMADFPTDPRHSLKAGPREAARLLGWVQSRLDRKTEWRNGGESDALAIVQCLADLLGRDVRFFSRTDEDGKAEIDCGIDGLRVANDIAAWFSPLGSTPDWTDLGDDPHRTYQAEVMSIGVTAFSHVGRISAHRRLEAVAEMTAFLEKVGLAEGEIRDRLAEIERCRSTE